MDCGTTTWIGTPRYLASQRPRLWINILGCKLQICAVAVRCEAKKVVPGNMPYPYTFLVSPANAPINF